MSLKDLLLKKRIISNQQNIKVKLGDRFGAFGGHNGEHGYYNEFHFGGSPETVLQDGIHPTFLDSPVSKQMKISDVCHYGPGDLNKLGKEGKTSWDSFSYALMMCHNVWQHINAVQTANCLSQAPPLYLAASPRTSHGSH